MKKLAQGFNTAAQDSNPGPFSRESGALPLSHGAHKRSMLCWSKIGVCHDEGTIGNVSDTQQVQKPRSHCPGSEAGSPGIVNPGASVKNRCDILAILGQSVATPLRAVPIRVTPRMF